MVIAYYNMKDYGKHLQVMIMINDVITLICK